MTRFYKPLPFALVLSLISGNSWAAGPGDLGSPALVAYLFIYTCLLAIAAVLIVGLACTGRREGQGDEQSFRPPTPHQHPGGQQAFRSKEPSLQQAG